MAGRPPSPFSNTWVMPDESGRSQRQLGHSTLSEERDRRYECKGMNVSLLIDAIVRESALLVAQLSTASGLRAPLFDVGEQMFLRVAREVEAQGVPRKVVADMFGLALRGYQRKVHRISESARAVGGTLWSAMVAFVQERGEVSRRELLARFRYDDPTSVGAVLSDLLSSGLITRSNSGDAPSYRLAEASGFVRIARDSSPHAAAAMLWATVYRTPGLTFEALAELVGLELQLVHIALEPLIGRGSIALRDGRLHAELLVIPVGAGEGWEAALFDHYHAVVTALRIKLRMGKTQSSQLDMVGGATLTFDVHPEHPLRADVLALLAKVRADVNALWEQVEGHNRTHPVPVERAEQVCFYFGQSWCKPGDDP
jgi:hypothetical protein